MIHGDQPYVEVGVLGEAFSSTTSTSASVLEDKRFRKQYPIAIGMAFLCFKLGTRTRSPKTTAKLI